MNVLILGGTRFVGRHIAEELHRAGHTVTILTRGVSRDALPAAIERIRGDRDAGLVGLGGIAHRTWHACVDVSGYTPRNVRTSAELLRDRIGRYVFISAVSVYGDPAALPVDEDHARVQPAPEHVTEVVGEMYGRLKVTCENIIQHIYAERGSILRPQVVAGPHDPFDRFSYWVRRATQDGETLAPGDGSDHVQVVDARDVARFTRIVLEQNLPEPYNVAGHRITWKRFIELLGVNNPAWVESKVIRSAGVTEFELPLFREERGQRSGLMHVSNQRAINAGFTLTDVCETIRRVREWLPSCELAPALSREREAQLIELARKLGPQTRSLGDRA